MARAGQPVAMTPFTLSGAMSPVTIAGALTQQNAEALALIALSQIVARRARRCSMAASPPMSTCAPARRLSARRNMPRRSSPRASWRGATTCPFRSSNVTASNCRRRAGRL